MDGDELRPEQAESLESRDRPFAVQRKALLHLAFGLVQVGRHRQLQFRGKARDPAQRLVAIGVGRVRRQAEREARLVSQYGGPSVDILQLPAGGHRRGTSRAFLEAVAPRVAIISTARFDRFDRPHEETLRRLEAVPLNWYATGECGAIRVRLRPGEAPAVHTANGAQTRFWRRRSGCP